MKSMKLKRNILPNAFIFLSFLEGLAVGGLELGGIGGCRLHVSIPETKIY